MSGSSVWPDQLTPLERTIRGALPAGVVDDEDAVARRVAYMVEQLHMAVLRRRIAELEAVVATMDRRSLDHVRRTIRRELGAA